MMNIEKQREVADYVLSRLELIDPYCILAGGAPRDWYFNEVANDLDFYMYVRPCTLDKLLKMLQQVLPECIIEPTDKRTHDVDLYKTMDSLRKVLNTEVGDCKVQIMILTEPDSTFKCLDEFSVSICKIWYKNGQIKRSKDFKITEVYNSMFLSEGYKWTDKHPNKIKERFKGHFNTSTKELIVKRIINDKLEEI